MIFDGINFIIHLCIYGGFGTYLLGLLLVHSFDSEKLGGLVMYHLEYFTYRSFSNLRFEFIIISSFVLNLMRLVLLFIII